MNPQKVDKNCPPPFVYRNIKAYEFYGVMDYVNVEDWTVNVEWDMENGIITFKKNGLPNLSLKVGEWGV